MEPPDLQNYQSFLEGGSDTSESDEEDFDLSTSRGTGAGVNLDDGMGFELGSQERGST